MRTCQNLLGIYWLKTLTPCIPTFCNISAHHVPLVVHIATFTTSLGECSLAVAVLILKKFWQTNSANNPAIKVKTTLVYRSVFIENTNNKELIFLAKQTDRLETAHNLTDGSCRNTGSCGNLASDINDFHKVIAQTNQSLSPHHGTPEKPPKSLKSYES
jgi:hypothetical protein